MALTHGTILIVDDDRDNRELLAETLGKTGYDGNNLRYMNTLSGAALDWMLEAEVELGQLIPYRYPTPEEFDEHGLQIVYLGWFLGPYVLFATTAAVLVVTSRRQFASDARAAIRTGSSS